MTTQRRVPKFRERAQALLDAHPWPVGFTVTVDPYSSAEHRRAGIGDVWVNGPGAARAVVPVDPYDLQSADPARVLLAAIKKLKAQARDPRYTEQSRRDDQAAAELLEGAV